MHTTRRDLFHATLAGAVVTAWPSSANAEEVKLWAGFPRQDQKLVAEIVGVSHFNEARVKELVKSHPALVNACWDWGFGDFETALGAASHTGQRGIAEFLLASGARIDIFAAAMLGFTDTVKAFVKAQPGVQRTLGPHGITLLAHAKAGGEQAADTLKYLESLGDAGTGIKVVPLTAEERKKYLGEFALPEAKLKLECRLNKAGQLVIDVTAGDTKTGNRVIHCVGEDEFYTAGVPGVRLLFKRNKEQMTSITIRGLGPELTLPRAGG